MLVRLVVGKLSWLVRLFYWFWCGWVALFAWFFAVVGLFNSVVHISLKVVVLFMLCLLISCGLCVGHLL